MPPDFVRSLVAVAALALMSHAAPTLAQKEDPAEARKSVELVRGLDAASGNNSPSSFSSSARYAYQRQVWDRAFEWSTTACNGNDARGCDYLGRLHAEGRMSAPNPRAAEIAHRKAASLYAAACRAATYDIGETCSSAIDFLRSDAVPAVRDERLAREFAVRALEYYVPRCTEKSLDCYSVGVLTGGTFTGTPNMPRAVGFWRRGCDAPVTTDDGRGAQSQNCDALVGQLAFGPESVRDRSEAFRRISTDQCSVAAPQPNRPLRGEKNYCAVIAEFLFEGSGVTADLKRGEQLMRMACALNQESACKSLDARGLGRDDMKGAVALRDLRMNFEAREAFETLCTANNANGCNEAGRLFERNDGNANLAKAQQYFARACTLGLAIGCANSGVKLRAAGGQANFIAARAALQTACNAKDASSCTTLGVMAERGEGGSASWPEAVRLYELGCSGGSPAGCNILGTAYVNGTGVAADPVRARALHQQACTMGHGNACNSYGYAMMIGRGGPRDDTAARALFEQQCQRENGNSCANLGQLLREGRGGPADHPRSRQAYRDACNLRIANGCIGWSDALLTSLGGPTDRAQAIMARRIACHGLDNAEACTWIAAGGHANAAEDGTILANSGKIARALPLLQQACTENNGKGCLGLAAFTPGGDKAAEDARTDNLQKACRLGEAEACKIIERRKGS